MQKKEWHRNVLIGCIVAAVFFGWWLRGFLFNWRFRLFSGRSWNHVAKEFETGWSPSSTSDWIFLLTLFFAMPAFLYLWYLCTRVNWSKLWKTVWKWVLYPINFIKKKFFGRTKTKDKTTKTVVLAPPLPPELPEKKEVQATSERPRPMSHSGGMTRVFQTAAGQATATTSTFTPQSSSSLFGQTGVGAVSDDPWKTADSTVPFEEQPLDEIQLPQREPVVEDIPALFQNAGYHLIEKVKTPLLSLDYVAICADKVYAVLIDREAGDWLAEEEPFNGEAPLWFSEIDHRVSPVYELRQCVDGLKQKIATAFPEFSAIPFMIEEKGNIINAEEMLRIWKEMNVVVARTDIGGLEDLPTATETITTVTPASVTEIETISKLLVGDKK